LRRACEIGERAGDLESAGIAALSTLEELSEQLKASEMIALYEQAIELLRESQHRGIPKRMLSCRDKVLSKVETLLILGRADAGTDMSGWDAFVFRKEIRRYERVFLERALKDAEGSPTRAAQLLGFKNHQSLISLINSQHESLIEARSTVRPRRRSILSEQKGSKELTIQPSKNATRKVAILHVEDNEVVASVVEDTILLEGWSVESCRDGEMALRMLASDAQYDLLIFDNELPGLNGVELVQRARKLPHRRRTPIIMLSGSDCEREAWRAGVDAFLRKGEDINALSSTIVRLLRVESED
jgi:CheY-like chemotaxis protein